MGFLSGISNSIGSLLNSATGVTSAGKQNQQYALQSAAEQYKYSKLLAAQEQKYALQSAAKQQQYALQSAKINNQYQKEFAQNSHQWAMQDLAKAGLNPVLAAGGGASASGGGVSAASVGSASLGGSSVGSGTQAGSGINPIMLGLEAYGSIANTAKTRAEKENIETDSLLKSYQTLTEIEKAGLTKAQAEQVEAIKKGILAKLPHEITQIKAETKYTNERARGHSTTSSRGLGGIATASESKTW